MYTVELPCKPGSDCWYVGTEPLEVRCEKGGIAGFAIFEGKILALDASGNMVGLHSRWCCLTREEAEEFKEKLLAEEEEE